MSERKINLEEILMSGSIGTLFRGTCNEKTYQFILGRMKEACRQTLELAAENAEISWVENDIEMESDTDFSFRDNDGNWCKVNINEQSILDTINQVE